MVFTKEDSVSSKKTKMKKVEDKNIKKVKEDKTPRKKYSTETVVQALKEIEEGSSLRKAAKTHGIPLTSIHRFIKNPEKICVKTGPPTTLSAADEQEIINWVNGEVESGNVITRTQLLDYIQQYVLNLNRVGFFKDGRPSRHWLTTFLKRHPEITIKSDTLAADDNLKSWFFCAQTHLESKNLKDIDSSQVFICDEAKINFDPESGELLLITDDNEDHTFSTFFLYNAEGLLAPPMLLKKKSVIKVEECIPNGWAFNVNESGSMTSEIFFNYITKVFYPWLLKNSIEFPIVMYLNGLWSHKTTLLEYYCKKNKIELISVFPDSTHIIQFNNSAFVQSFQDICNKIIYKWKVGNDYKELSKKDFAIVLKKFLDILITKRSIIQKWFKEIGLMPFNPQAVNNNIPKRKHDNCLISIDDSFSKNTVQQDEQLTKNFEDSLPDDLIQNFETCKASKIWKGDVKLTGLFEYWLKIKTGKTSTLNL